MEVADAAPKTGNASAATATAKMTYSRAAPCARNFPGRANNKFDLIEPPPFSHDCASRPLAECMSTASKFASVSKALKFQSHTFEQRQALGVDQVATGLVMFDPTEAVYAGACERCRGSFAAADRDEGDGHGETQRPGELATS